MLIQYRLLMEFPFSEKISTSIEKYRSVLFFVSELQKFPQKFPEALIIDSQLRVSM